MKKIFSIGLIFLFFSLAHTITAAATIAVVKSDEIKPYQLAVEGFKKVCKENFLEYNIESDIDKAHIIASELKKERPDVIFVLGAKAAYAISQDIKDIPIIFCMVTEPEKYGLEGGNITGIKYSIPVEEQMKIFNEMFPGLKKVGIIYNSSEVQKYIQEAKKIAKKYDIEIDDVYVRSKDKIPDAVEQILENVDLLWLVYDPEITASRRVITDTVILPALQKKIPIIGFNKWSVTVGALMCMYSDYISMGEEAGIIANKILQGYLPSSIKVKSPEKVNVLVNPKALKRITEKVEVVMPDDTYIYEG